MRSPSSRARAHTRGPRARPSVGVAAVQADLAVATNDATRRSFCVVTDCSATCGSVSVINPANAASARPNASLCAHPKHRRGERGRGDQLWTVRRECRVPAAARRCREPSICATGGHSFWRGVWASGIQCSPSCPVPGGDAREVAAERVAVVRRRRDDKERLVDEAPPRRPTARTARIGWSPDRRAEVERQARWTGLFLALPPLPTPRRGARRLLPPRSRAASPPAEGREQPRSAGRPRRRQRCTQPGRTTLADGSRQEAATPSAVAKSPRAHTAEMSTIGGE